MQHRTGTAPRVPHRVIETRDSFTQRPRSKWRGHLAVTVLAIGGFQFCAWVGHIVWTAEVQMWRWAFP